MAQAEGKAEYRKAEYGKRVQDLSVAQLESQLQKAFDESTPPDALENMPIAALEEAHAGALGGLGFYTPGITLRCSVVCSYEYPPGKVICRLQCDVSF